MIKKRICIFITMMISLVFSACTTSQIQTPRQMQGMYSYMADAAIFQECDSGIKYPVVFEEDSIELERVYLQTRRVAGEAIKIDIEGEIVFREGMDGGKTQPMILVKKFIKIIPKEHCQNRLSQASLKNTYWKLTQLNTKPIKRSSRREAHMVLQENGMIKGNSGCNVMRGRYILNGDKISLDKRPMAMSRMFCQGSVEREFMKALSSMHTYKVKGEYLEVFDENGVKLARFESVYLH